MVARTPYYVFVDKDFKEILLQYLNDKRGVMFEAATNENALLFKDITMASTDFIDMLQKVGVDHVTIMGYGQKASVKWGFNIMKVARSVDKKCLCEYDFATHIPPPLMHWARFDVHNMAPFRAMQNEDGKTSNAFNHITLVACTKQSSIKRKFGKSTKINHWPQFPLAQLEQNGFECIPIYGSFTIIPLKGFQNRHEPPHHLDMDNFDTDEEQSVNLDLDFDGTDGRCIINATIKICQTKHDLKMMYFFVLFHHHSL